MPHSVLRRTGLIRLASIMTVLGMTIVSCSSDHAPESQAATTIVASATTSEQGSLGELPASLKALEEGAEDIIDLVAADGWEKITADVEAMGTAWTEYQPAASAADPTLAESLDGAMSELTEAAGRKDGPATAQAANHVSAPVTELFARYDIGRPVQIGRLDVIGRQIILDVQLGNVTRAGDWIASARAQWTVLRPDIVDHDGAQVASNTDDSFATLEAALGRSDTAALVEEAANLLELVDEMERLY